MKHVCFVRMIPARFAGSCTLKLRSTLRSTVHGTPCAAANRTCWSASTSSTVTELDGIDRAIRPTARWIARRVVFSSNTCWRSSARISVVFSICPRILRRPCPLPWHLTT